MTKEIQKKGNVPIAITKLISGISAPANELRRLMTVVAPTGSSALILGPTGSGKELVAQGIHSASGRKGPLISVNCAAIPTELLESELFGHEKGAFTGADKVRAGRFEQSSGGTLFLDEIGDMPLSLQSKLLRALENKTIQRVGGDKEIKIDLRLICATHQNIKKNTLMKVNLELICILGLMFFQLLFQVLLKELLICRSIVEFMLNELKIKGESVPKFDQSAFQELGRYNWPGNIRELRNVVERAAVLFWQTRK